MDFERFEDLLRRGRETRNLPAIAVFGASNRLPEDDTLGAGEKRSEGILTPRERGVLQLMGLGLSNKRIAQRLGIAPETVKSHAKNIFVRLGSATRAEAVSRSASLGLI